MLPIKWQNYCLLCPKYNQNFLKTLQVKKNVLVLKSYQKSMNPAEPITNTDYVDDITLLANTLQIPSAEPEAGSRRH